MKHTTKRISALLLALTLLLTVMSGCGSTTPAAAGATAAPTAAAAEVPAAEDPAAAPADAPVIEGLTFTEESPLKYATVFRLFRYEGGYTLIRIDNGGDFLVVPEGAAVPAKMDSSVTVLQQPLDKIYLAATSAMSLFAAVDALDHIRLTGTRESGWYIDAAVEAMQRGDIEFAGKYSEPNYERLIDEECDLAIESTMIYHTPKVKEQLERLGIPVLVERSSYESNPLGRMEWIKLYGVLTGKEEQAEALYDEQLDALAPILDQPSTGKTAAFFYITANGAANVRKSTDYVAKMLELAGGKYIFDDLTDDDARSTMNMQMESFYAGAKDADVLIYNSTIDGELQTLDELLAKSPLLADFKAVKNGNVWCTEQSLFQSAMGLGGMIQDFHTVFTGENTDDLHYLHQLT